LVRAEGTAIEPDAPPDAGEIAAIVRQADVIVRNLQITLGYHRLSHAWKRFLGGGDANWCTFATWASKRAGYTMRGDVLGELRERVRLRLEQDAAYRAALHRLAGRLGDRHALAALAAEHVASRVLDPLQAVSALVGRGNLEVFAELAPEFAALAAWFDGDTALDREKLERFVVRFRPGSTSDGGQDLLRSAYTQYGVAAFESDPRVKAELILLANLQVGLHEQTRLQPYIAGALDAPVRRLPERLEQDVRARLPLWKRWAVRLAGRWLLGPVLADVTRIWREEATRYLMQLPVPGEVLGLGWDVPSPHGQPMFPEVLQDLRNQDLVALLQQYDRTWNTTAGSGAQDWASLADRMHYIADLFRSRQRTATLYDSPFTVDQCAAIREGRIPSGEL
jgi:hypothetical protein